MNPLNNLSEKEREALLRYPVYVTLLAANVDGRLDNKEKESAVELANIRSYNAPPLLEDFYKEVNENFEENLRQVDKSLPVEKESREAAIRQKLDGLEKIVMKIGGKYAAEMYKSMSSFKNHVFKAHGNVMVDFLFPMPIYGISED